MKSPGFLTCRKRREPGPIKELRAARLPVSEVMDGAPTVPLERERKAITDTLKMVA